MMRMILLQALCVYGLVQMDENTTKTIYSLAVPCLPLPRSRAGWENVNSVQRG